MFLLMHVNDGGKENVQNLYHFRQPNPFEVQNLLRAKFNYYQVLYLTQC